MTLGPGLVRAQYVREQYPHEHGTMLINTTQAMALTGLKRDTLLRRMVALKLTPVRRGGHGRMLWRHADVLALVDNELHACDSDARSTLPKSR